MRPNPRFKPFAGFAFVLKDRLLEVRGHDSLSGAQLFR